MHEISSAHFKWWLGQQDPAAAYKYVVPSDCLVARYMKAHGFTHVSGGPGTGDGVRSDGVRLEFRIPHGVEHAAINGGTYGGALALLQ